MRLKTRSTANTSRTDQQGKLRTLQPTSRLYCLSICPHRSWHTSMRRRHRSKTQGCMASKQMMTSGQLPCCRNQADTSDNRLGLLSRPQRSSDQAHNTDKRAGQRLRRKYLPNRWCRLTRRALVAQYQQDTPDKMLRMTARGWDCTRQPDTDCIAKNQLRRCICRERKARSLRQPRSRRKSKLRRRPRWPMSRRK